MSVFSQLASRQLSVSGRCQAPLSLSWLYGDLCCHRDDETSLQGGITMGPTPPFVCKFTPDGLHGNLLAVGDEEGSIRLFDTRRSLAHSAALLTDLHAHSNAIFDLAWIPGGTKLLTASGDRSVRLWDVVATACLATFKAHQGSVKTVDVQEHEPSVFVSGGRDGSIRLWDTRCATRGSQHRPVNRISMAHKKLSSSSSSLAVAKRKGRGMGSATPTECQHGVTAVLFNGENKLASAGAVDGVVKLWDLRRTYSTCKVEPPPAWHVFEPTTSDQRRSHGFTSLVANSTHSTLFASCTNDIVYQYSSSTLNRKPVRGFSGHRSSSFYVKTSLSPDGCHLLSGSSCGRGFIWEVARPEAPPLTLCGHNAEVTAVDWSPTQDKIATCSDNNDMRLWRVVRPRPSCTDGEYIGSSITYDGKGHLKARDELASQSQEPSSQGAVARQPLQGLQDKHPLPPPPSSSCSSSKEPASKKKKTTTLLRFLSRGSSGLSSEPACAQPVTASDTSMVPDLGYGSLESDNGIMETDVMDPGTGISRELTPENNTSGSVDTRVTNCTRKRKLLLDSPPLITGNGTSSTTTSSSEVCSQPGATPTQTSIRPTGSSVAPPSKKPRTPEQ